MCGISGEIRFDGVAADVAVVDAMTAGVAARGPDGQGRWSAGWVALGHRRLSIIDLSAAGAQPMVDEARGLAVVFNGCIYNYRQLRAELGAAGYRFASASDTEVLLAAYDRWGEDFVERLVGMFAIALVDRRRRRVVLARDRLGIKPLYLAGGNGWLRFASSLPVLARSGGVDTGLDAVALHHYLTWHSIVPGERTILRGVRKLPPATVRVVEPDGRCRDRVYWQPRYERDPELAALGPAQWRAALRRALSTAVQRRLVADVPVGVLLSGGLDSSLIVALLADAGVDRVQTFSIGFDSAAGQDGDEFRYSDIVAGAFDTDHHRIRVPDAELLPAIDDAVAAMPEPLGSHDTVAFHLLCRQVSGHVKVAQSGQGADEIFAGYSYHQAAAGVPRAGAGDALVAAFADRDQAEVDELLAPEYRLGRDAGRELLDAHLGRPGAQTALDAVLRLDTHLLMPDDPVKRVDAMSMASGLEVRVPFLDQDLVELAAKCPPELKAAQGGKGILKDIGRELLPEAVIDRPKGYFPVPALHRLRGPLLDLVGDALTNPAAKQRGLFRPEYVEALLADPSRRTTPTKADKLWQLGLLELWLQAHEVG